MPHKPGASTSRAPARAPGGQPLYYPATSFWDLFDAVTMRPGSYDAPAGFESRQIAAGIDEHGERETMYLSTFCPITGNGRREHVWARPKDAVVDAVLSNTILFAEHMSFKVIHWDNGQALVLCEHSRIIGSVWLAIVPSSTVPSTGLIRR